MELRKIKTKLTDQYLHEELPTVQGWCNKCDACGAVGYQDPPVMYTDPESGSVITLQGRIYNKTMFRAIGEILCEKCFVREYYNGPTNDVPKRGNPHLTTPHSQWSYDGGRFGSGEW